MGALGASQAMWQETACSSTPYQRLWNGFFEEMKEAFSAQRTIIISYYGKRLRGKIRWLLSNWE